MPTEESDVTRKMALFVDLENLVLGVRETGDKKFKIKLVLQRLLEKGHVLIKRAYAAWRRFEDYKRPFHESAIEMVEIPGLRMSGKNSADIKMVVDVMDIAHQRDHVDTFVIASGDSDFSPLVSKLRENDKYVIGIGVKQSTSDLLRDNCDEFMYYGDLVRTHEQAQRMPVVEGAAERTVEGFRLLVDAIHALLRNNRDVVWGSMVKQTICRKSPSFEESYYGYKSFTQMLEDAQRHKVLTLEKDGRSGYRITGVAEVG
jgi:uncharacterized protein (TIGR00288 family)